MIKKKLVKFNSGEFIGTYCSPARIDKEYMKEVYGDRVNRFLRVRKLVDPENKLLNGKEIV
jgi:hypothetical protein